MNEPHGTTYYEEMAWKLLSIVIGVYDDHGIVLHGRVYNQGDDMCLDLVSAQDFCQLCLIYSREQIDTIFEVDTMVFADSIAEHYVPKYADIRAGRPNITSLHEEMFRKDEE